MRSEASSAPSEAWFPLHKGRDELWPGAFGSETLTEAWSPAAGRWPPVLRRAQEACRPCRTGRVQRGPKSRAHGGATAHFVPLLHGLRWSSSS